MAYTNVSDLIERLEAFEDRLNVRIEALSAHLSPFNDDYIVEVRGELHPKAGMELGHDNLELTAAVYDSHSRVIGTGGGWFSKDKFFGFEVFCIDVHVPVNNLKRIRI